MSDATIARSKPTRECKVDDLESLHPQISANDWRSPLVLRMLGKNTYSDGAGEMTVRYEWRTDKQTTNLKLVWRGLASDFAKRVHTYQSPVLTEFATLGLACVLIAEFPKRTIGIINFWGNTPEMSKLKGELSDLLLFSNVDEIMEKSDKIVTEITALAKVRHKDILS